VLAIYARENGQGMAFPASLPENDMGDRASAEVFAESSPSVASKVVQLVSTDPVEIKPDPDLEPPKPPAGPRPALKRVK
jgi:stringent starvation protein B